MSTITDKKDKHNLAIGALGLKLYFSSGGDGDVIKVISQKLVQRGMDQYTEELIHVTDRHGPKWY